MKIQCDVYKRAASAVLCCADKVALCWGCDEEVHTTNKLAEKHQRVPLLPTNSNSSSSSSSSSSQVPICNICQSCLDYWEVVPWVAEEEENVLTFMQPNHDNAQVDRNTALRLVKRHKQLQASGLNVAKS
ncbi:B-box zinc finger protein 22-like [Canna indica]|uniref:B-box zinc finger protein 22-like n=1 Tax=Canna indica TaxID=4628 RepID=A0AAQ3KC90_9LILI|nr:B-box zinc finger protein 22-like [Canna indica]